MYKSCLQEYVGCLPIFPCFHVSVFLLSHFLVFMMACMNSIAHSFVNGSACMGHVPVGMLDKLVIMVCQPIKHFPGFLFSCDVKQLGL